MNNFWSECIEQDDDREEVMHEVHASLDGVKYRIKFTASCPMIAIKIAQRIPTVYWEIENG